MMKHSWQSILSMVLHLVIVSCKSHLKPINQCQYVLSSPQEEKKIVLFSSFVCAHSLCFSSFFIEQKQSSKKQKLTRLILCFCIDIKEKNSSSSSRP